MIQIASLEDARLDPYRVAADPAAIARHNLFVAEGRWVVERLLARTDYDVHSVLVTPTAAAALARGVGDDAMARQRIYVIDQPLMDRVVGFHIHRGCLALAERPPVRTLTEASLGGKARVLILEGVNNPDNVGGLFRSAAAFGVELVVLGPACGDPLYRKAVRTSMAATLDVPYETSDVWPSALETVRRAGLQLLALTPHESAAPLESLVPGPRVALLVGTEGAGLTPGALACADRRLRIRMAPGVDSLNVTVAASIALHHVAVASPI